MKNFSTTGLFALIVFILVLFTGYDYWSTLKKADRQDAEAKVIQLAKADIDSIEVKTLDEKNVSELRHFKKENGAWKILAPVQESADQQIAMTYLEQLTNERMSETVKEGSDLNLDLYGLKKPLFELVIKAGATTQTLKIGSIKAFDGSLYAQINDQNKVVLVSNAWDVILSKPITDFRDKRLYRGPIKTEFTSITVDGRDARGPLHFQISPAKDGLGWALKDSSIKDQLAKGNIEAWIEQIKALRGSTFSNNASLISKADTLNTFKITLVSTDLKTPTTIELIQDKRNFDHYEATGSDVPNGERLELSKEAAVAVWMRTEMFYSKKDPFNFDEKAVARVLFTRPAQASGKTKGANETTDTLVDAAHPDPMIAKLRALEAVRFLGLPPGRSKFHSTLKLLNAAGGLVFEMSWGDPVTESSTVDRPEARYLEVKTNLSSQVIGITEKQIEDLASPKR